MGLVKDHEIIWKEVTDPLVLGIPKESEEEGVIEHKNLGRLRTTACRLIEASGVTAAGLWRAEMLLTADLGPELLCRLEGKIAERSVRGYRGPLPDAFQLRLLLSGKEIAAMAKGAGKPGGADVVLTSLEQNCLELLTDQTPHQRDILVKQLFLKVDSVGADQGLPPCPDGMKDGGDQVGQRFPDAGSGLNHKMGAICQCPGHPFRHALLLGTPFKTPDRGKRTLRPEEFRNLTCEASRHRGSAGSELFINGNHRYRSGGQGVYDCRIRRKGLRIVFFPASCNGFLPVTAMTIFDRYLLNKFLIPFFYCVSGFISVWLVWDLSVNLTDFLSGHATFALVTRYYLLQIPSVIVLSVPVGLLLALLYTLTQMSRRNEIISMLCAGVSLYRIFVPLVIVGLLMTALLGVLNYRLAPQAGSSSEEIKSEIKSGQKPFNGIGNHLFRNREDRRLWYMTALLTKANLAVNVQIIQQNESGIVTEKWYTPHALFVPATGIWLLRDARHVIVDESGNQVSSESSPRLEIKGWHETPWKIASSTMNSEFMGLPELTDYLRYNAEFPETRLAPFVTHWNYRWALPWICFVVIFIAGPMGVVIGRRGIMGGVTAAIGLFASLIFSSSLFIALGKGDRIPGWVAGWGPILIFLSIGFLLFWIKATGRELPKLRLPGF